MKISLLFLYPPYRLFISLCPYNPVPIYCDSVSLDVWVFIIVVVTIVFLIIFIVDVLLFSFFFYKTKKYFTGVNEIKYPKVLFNRLKCYHWLFTPTHPWKYNFAKKVAPRSKCETHLWLENTSHNLSDWVINKSIKPSLVTVPRLDGSVDQQR